MDNFDSQPSSSSSSFSNIEGIEKVVLNNLAETNIQEPLTSASDKIEVENNLKSDSQPESENQNQDEDEEKCFIDELPPEMLIKIFKHLNAASLLDSRLVSRKWNGILYEILQSRNDVEIGFDCRVTEDESLKIEGKTPRASLSNFIKYFEDSTDSPLYTRFRFNRITASVFECEDWLKFISVFGQSVKCLKLEVDESESVEDVARFTEKLRQVLLNPLPKLEEFGLRIPEWTQFTSMVKRYFHALSLSSIQILPITTTSTSKEIEETSPVLFQLPHLKVLYLDEQNFSNFSTEIMTHLLCASVNLTKIEPFQKYTSFKCTDTLHFLQTLGKLHCVQTAQLSLDEFVAETKETGSTPLAFKLKELDLDVESVYEDVNIWWDAAGFLSHVFEFCKDTLQKLTVHQMGFLSDLPLPKFSKLTTLFIKKMGEGENIQVLPGGLQLKQVFPVLRHLELSVSWTDFCPYDESQNEDDSRLPNLKILKITGDGMTKEDVARISQVCPNLKELKICNGYFARPIKNFPEVGEAIWTHLTRLESLDLKIDVQDPANAFPAVDSTFTGFSGEDSIRLHNLIEDENSAAERITPSISDLKDLRNLTVTLWMAKKDDEETPNFANDMLIISEKYAFQLMKNLTYKIKKEAVEI